MIKIMEIKIININEDDGENEDKDDIATTSSLNLFLLFPDEEDKNGVGSVTSERSALKSHGSAMLP